MDYERNNLKIIKKMSYFSKKTLESVLEKSKTSGLAKTLTSVDLVLFGLGAIIGTGVFVFTGIVAAKYSGPAVMLSYAVAGITCIFVALTYTEIAALIPSSGSAYTYSYVAYGELIAWMMMGVLMLELNFGAATVASSWSSFIVRLLKDGNIIDLPKYLTTNIFEGGLINLPAIFITLFVTAVLYLGTKDSKKLNAVLVIIKMAAIIAFILAATPHFDSKYWDNFMPFGFDNVLVGSSLLFFAYTGFSAIASTADECKNPRKDMLIGIIGSLLLTTIIYIIIGGLLTGIAPISIMNCADSMSNALEYNNSKIGSVIVAVGAVCGMTTVLMLNIYAQSRIFYVISSDGLLPKSFSKLHHKYDSPYFSIILFGIITSIFSSIIPLEILGQLSSMGAILDYIIVITIVVYFRFKYPDLERPFKCPALYIIAPIAFFSCIYLLLKQIISKDGGLLISGALFGVWFLIIFFLYFVNKLIKRQSLETE